MRGFNGVLGHEFVGRVVGVAPVSAADARADAEADAVSWIGKRVVGDINCACTACGVCERAEEDARCSPAAGPPGFLNDVRAMARNHCPRRRVLGILAKDGTYADFLTIPLENLHEVPDSVSSENAAFVEPLAAAYRIVEQGLLPRAGAPPPKVAVVGDGKLGLLIAEIVGRHVKSTFGGRAPPVDIVGRHLDKMRLVSGEADVRALLEGDVRAQSDTYFKAYDVVIDATGHPSGLALSADLVRCMGTIVLKSTCAVDHRSGAPFNTAAYVINEVTVRGEPGARPTRTPVARARRVAEAMPPRPPARQARGAARWSRRSGSSRTAWTSSGSSPRPSTSTTRRRRSRPPGGRAPSKCSCGCLATADGDDIASTRVGKNSKVDQSHIARPHARSAWRTRSVAVGATALRAALVTSSCFTATSRISTSTTSSISFHSSS